MSLLDRLKGGDRRSIGASGEVVRKVLKDPQLLSGLVAGLRHRDPIVAMRCADVAEKVSARHPGWLQPHAALLVSLMTQDQAKEIKWHLAQMAPRLALTAEERARAISTLFGYLEADSRIVQTFALQELANLAVSDTALRRRLHPIIGRAAADGSPALRARARKLLSRGRED